MSDMFIRRQTGFIQERQKRGQTSIARDIVGTMRKTKRGDNHEARNTDMYFSQETSAKGNLFALLFGMGSIHIQKETQDTTTQKSRKE